MCLCIYIYIYMYIYIYIYIYIITSDLFQNGPFKMTIRAAKGFSMAPYQKQPSPADSPVSSFLCSQLTLPQQPGSPHPCCFSYRPSCCLARSLPFPHLFMWLQVFLLHHMGHQEDLSEPSKWLIPGLMTAKVPGAPPPPPPLHCTPHAVLDAVLQAPSWLSYKQLKSRLFSLWLLSPWGSAWGSVLASAFKIKHLKYCKFWIKKSTTVTKATCSPGLLHEVLQVVDLLG
jgi:hypothetical protein